MNALHTSAHTHTHLQRQFERGFTSRLLVDDNLDDSMNSLDNSGSVMASAATMNHSGFNSMLDSLPEAGDPPPFIAKQQVEHAHPGENCSAPSHTFMCGAALCCLQIQVQSGRAASKPPLYQAVGSAGEEKEGFRVGAPSSLVVPRAPRQHNVSLSSLTPGSPLVYVAAPPPPPPPTPPPPIVIILTTLCVAFYLAARPTHWRACRHSLAGS